ncbi:MAG TPA: lysylphosphatidylglycerol synthase transmembrane domain-containing protein [Ilumatobacteraceae bacterium]|nr:lysylphosphatidylglycerol synthase transmembrane domain-containing protein [Ilumatobacteraceae bacterium]
MTDDADVGSANHTGELPRLSPDDTGGPPRPRRIRPVHFTLKLGAFIVVLYFGFATIIPGVRKSWGELRNVSPWLLLGGLALEIAALYAYSLLTKAALGDAGHDLSTFRLFRIQMSTKALSSIVPGGSAAGSALGYRLMTLSGVPGPDAGFALATAGLGSAVVLNLLFWAGLLISIPIRGVNPGYASAAVAGIVLMVIAGALVVGLLEGQHTAERVIRWVARRMRLSEERASAGVRQIAGRLEDLVADKGLLFRVIGWAAANWLLDIAALWVFLRAFGESTDVDAIIVAFGLVNVLAVIPITPGGLGIIDGGLPLALTGFGLTKAVAVLGTATYRLAQYFFPIVLGGMLYASLRVGPWSIKRREKLKRLRELAGEAAESSESVLDFTARFARRRRTGDASSTNGVGDGA